MADLMELLPHSKKDVKLDTKNERAVVNEVADLKVGWAGSLQLARMFAPLRAFGGWGPSCTLAT